MVVNHTAVVTVKPKFNERFPCVDSLFLKFASSDLDGDGQQKPLIEAVAILEKESEQEYKYVAEIEVPKGFGEIGAVIIELDDNSTEKYIDTVAVQNITSLNSVTFSCNSWVQPKSLIPDQRRIFFSTKSYLPQNTPAGLVKLRAKDLANLRGQKPDGTEDKTERKAFERIYDYDVYNDLGNPDVDMQLKRPVLGGSEQYPYPRRCRTGRDHCDLDLRSEKRGKESFYVPRDEAFSEVKQKLFPPYDPGHKDPLKGGPFSDFTQIDLMFRDGIEIPPSAHDILKINLLSILSSDQPALPSVEPSTIQPGTAKLIKFPPPEAFKRDKFNWLSDSEFARQTLAGLNPYSIQLVKSLPLMSELNPKDYGPRESKFTTELVQKLIGSSITVQEALKNKKLFVLDYHDTLMQYVSKVRSINGTTLYGSRTLFFLNSDETLTPLAIELTRPPMDGKPQWKQVFSPSTHATDAWLWRLAKAHVLAHDSCVHQLVIHWLRTHCCMEPYAIATNRQLSTMHPIYRLLHPHFRFNMRINTNARESLINAGGIIERTFSAASYSMEFSSSVYKKEWRFDSQALPEDLIRRGMAERDEHAPHGLKLAINDYPFANDGLILWDALLEWMTKYVYHYYPDERAIKNDKELKAWWKEIMEKGHPDKKKEAGWPALKTPKDLIQIVSTIAWVGCGHHSAVNFIQYAHAGYFPSRPSIARSNMPTEDYDEIPEDFINHPEDVMLQAFPLISQASIVAQTMIILSAHSPDEEYIGEKIEAAWADDPIINEAFKTFKLKLDQLEKTIDEKNGDKKLKNRHGAGVMPYEVFKPTSTYGITGKGVPYSVST